MKIDWNKISNHFQNLMFTKWLNWLKIIKERSLGLSQFPRKQEKWYLHSVSRSEMSRLGKAGKSYHISQLKVQTQKKGTSWIPAHVTQLFPKQCLISLTSLKRILWVLWVLSEKLDNFGTRDIKQVVNFSWALIWNIYFKAEISYKNLESW